MDPNVINNEKGVVSALESPTGDDSMVQRDAENSQMALAYGSPNKIRQESKTPASRPDSVRRDQSSLPSSVSQQKLNEEGVTTKQNATVAGNKNDPSHESVAKDSLSPRRNLEIASKSTDGANEDHERNELMVQKADENKPTALATQREPMALATQTSAGTDFTKNILPETANAGSNHDSSSQEQASIPAQIPPQRLNQESITQQQPIADELSHVAKDSFSLREEQKIPSTGYGNDSHKKSEVMVHRNHENNKTTIEISKLPGSDCTENILPETTPLDNRLDALLSKEQHSAPSQIPQQRLTKESMTPKQIASIPGDEDKLNHESSLQNSISPRQELETPSTGSANEYHERNEVIIQRNNEKNDQSAVATHKLSGTDCTRNNRPESKLDDSNKEQASAPTQIPQQSLFSVNQESMTPPQVLSISGNGLTNESAAKDSFSTKRELAPSWSSCPPMSTGRYRFASAIHQNRIYIFGGGKGQLNTVKMYDLKSKEWRDLPSMTKNRCGCSCAVVGDKIYVFGGEYDREKYSTNCFEIYDTKTETWSSPSSRMNFATNRHDSISVGKKIFVFGGYKNKGRGACYDTETDTWTEIATMNEERYSFGAVVAGNYIYAIGGKKDFRKSQSQQPQYSRYLETMEIYDIMANTWTLSKATMKNRRCGCSAVKIGSTITVLGGLAVSRQSAEEYVTAVETFHIGKDVWSGSFIPSLTSGKAYMCAQISGDNELFVIGGSKNWSLCLASVESCKVPDIISKFDIPKGSEARHIVPSGNADTNLDREHNKRTSKRNTSKRQKSQEAKEVFSRAKRPRLAKQIKQENETVKEIPKKPLTRFEFQSDKVAKLFTDGENPGIYYGDIIEYDPVKRYWTIKYEDDDSEQFDRAEVLEGKKLYTRAQDRGRNKLFFEITKTTCIKTEEKETITKTKAMPKRSSRKTKETITKSKAMSKKVSEQTKVAKSSPTALGNKLQQLSEKLKAKLAELDAKEKKIIGKKQSGSLKDRLEKLKHVDDLVAMEMSIFGGCQKGTLEQRMKNVDDFMKDV